MKSLSTCIHKYVGFITFNRHVLFKWKKMQRQRKRASKKGYKKNNNTCDGNDWLKVSFFTRKTFYCDLRQRKTSKNNKTEISATGKSDEKPLICGNRCNVTYIVS